MGFVFGWLPWDSVADFSPLSRQWLHTKCGFGFGFADVDMVVMGLGLGLPAWVWGLWVVAADRLVEVVVDRLPWVWLECEKKYIKKELFYNILI